MPNQPSIAWIKFITPSSSFGPSLECPVLKSAQISWISPLSASLIFLDLALVIGPTRTCNGSLNALWFSSFPVGFLRVFEKLPCMAIYIKKIEVWNDSQTMWDSFQTLALMQKTCIFMFLEPFMCTQDWACVCMQHGYAHKQILTCAYRGFPWFNFPKIDLFAH